MDHDHDVAGLESKRASSGGVEDGGDFLHLEVVVAAPQGAHLVALPFLGTLRNHLRVGARHPALLLDALEVRSDSPTALDRPARTAGEHRVHPRGFEANGAGAAHARRDAGIQGFRQLPLHRDDVGAVQSRMQAAHSAGDVEADAARGNHAALIGIESGDAADRKAVSPVRIRHGIGGPDDAGEPGDVDRLLIHLPVHRAQQRLGREDHGRHAHVIVRADLPLMRGSPGEEIQVHGSDIHHGLCQPLAVLSCDA